MNQFGAVCATQGCALRPDQQNQLVELLIKSRREHGWTTSLSRRDHPIHDYAAFFNPSDLDAFSREEEGFDRSFLDAARAILSVEQLAVLNKFQASQRSSQLAQVTMAARLLTPSP